MNTAVRALSHSSAITEKTTWKLPSREILIVAALLTGIFISSLGVIYDQAMNRILFSQLQSLQKSRDNLYLEWGQLLLEQSTWATQARVQNIAQKDLSMYFPNQKNVVVVNE